VLAHRDAAGGLVADVAGGGGENDVLGGNLEERGGGRDVVGVAGAVEGEDRIGGAARGERGPRHRHGVAAEAGGRGAVGHGGVVGGRGVRQEPRDDRAVDGGGHAQRVVGAAVDADGLGPAVERDPLPVPQVGAVVVDALEVEVDDVGAEVGQPPGEVGVVADDDAGHAGEVEARDVEGAQRADL